MTLPGSEDETTKVSLVLQSVDRAPLPNPRLESVSVSGAQAEVHLVGANGLWPVSTWRTTRGAGG